MIKFCSSVLIVVFFVSMTFAESLSVKPGDGKNLSQILSTPGLSEVVLEDGIWFLPNTLKLDANHSNLVIRAAQGAKPIISGGVPITDWKMSLKNPQNWTAKAPAELTTVRQLFSKENGWFQRSRIPNWGWFRGDKLSTIDFDVNRTGTRDRVNDWRTSQPHIFAGLRYREDDKRITRLPKLPKGAMVQTISAWESAWHSLRDVDHESRDIRLFTPSRYPLAHWNYGVNEGGGTPYAIENTKEGFNRLGEWYFDTESRLIHLYANHPNDQVVIASHLSKIVSLDGCENTKFEGITFAHSRDVLGRYDQHKDWPTAIKTFDPTFPDNFPEGTTVPQSAPFTGEAVTLKNCQSVKFDSCIFRELGGYAIRIGQSSHKNLIHRCLITEIGAGGINIDPGPNRPNEDSYPSQNIVEDSTITRGGKKHPAAVAIRIAEAKNNVIRHNRISHFGYSGISIGWAWNPRPNHTTGNQIFGNDISNVMQTLSDGAGIYTLGAIPGTRIIENYIHNVARSKIAIGAGNSGIFFDQYSKGAFVKRNVIRNINSWHPDDNREPHSVKYNRNQSSDHEWVENDIDAGTTRVRLADTVSRSGPRKEIHLAK